MVALVSLALSLAGTVGTIAIAWGVFSTRVHHLEAGLGEVKKEQGERDTRTVARFEKLEGQQGDTAVRLARIEEQQAQSIRLLEEMKALLTVKRRR